jgi:hypothetical protein
MCTAPSGAFLFPRPMAWFETGRRQWEYAEGEWPMGIPKARFTIRRMMIGIAVIAAVFGLGSEGMRLKQFRDRCLMKATYHDAVEQASLLTVEISNQRAAALEAHERDSRDDSGSLTALSKHYVNLQEDARSIRRQAIDEREHASRCARLAEYHAALKKKYRQAADRPWAPVVPDGPRP